MRLITLLFITVLSFQIINAAEFTVPTQVPAVLGQWERVTISSGDNLGRLAKRYDVSMHNIILHNPSLNDKKYIHPGDQLIMPSCYWLPQMVQPGEILVNIATQTLFFRPVEQDKLFVYPVTVGMPDNPTPTGEFYVKRKKQNPIWYPTESVRASYAKKGVHLPFAVEGGAGNPLGAYALYLNKPTYLIHTASNINALGGRQSFGCIRMYEKDISVLYQQVTVKTTVRIIDEPNPQEDALFNNCAKHL
jgi:L,D-transpeptidase ErfK/SrfK